MSKLTRAVRSLATRWGARRVEDPGNSGLDPARQRKVARKRYIVAAAARRDADRAAIRQFEPDILRAFDLINDHSQKNMDDAINRAADILRWLDRRKPRAIHELGSGRSSVVYAVWASRNGARHTAFEESAAWQSLTMRAIEIAGGKGEVILTPVERTNTAASYFRAIPQDADFIYVDGPSGGRTDFATPDGRAISMDIVEHVRGGALPGTIMFDGRETAFRALLSLQEARHYAVSPQYHLAGELRGDPDALNRHTVMSLIPPNIPSANPAMD
jgi:hypothetical protein